MNVDQIALKLYETIDTHQLDEAKRNGNALEYFIRIARALEQDNAPRAEQRVEPVREVPAPQRRIRESDLEASRIEERRTRRRTTSPTSSVDEGIRVSDS